MSREISSANVIADAIRRAGGWEDLEMLWDSGLKSYRRVRLSTMHDEDTGDKLRRTNSGVRREK